MMHNRVPSLPVPYLETRLCNGILVISLAINRLLVHARFAAKFTLHTHEALDYGPAEA